MKRIIWVLLLGVFSGGCNKVNDIQPADQEGEVPVSAIEAVTGQFPQAKDMVFKTLEKNRVWQVAFSQNAARYSAATDQQLLLVAYQLADRSLPDSLTSLVRSTVIDGGAFSNLKVQNYSWFKDPANNGQFIFADYDWRGNSYTFRWTVTNISGRITYVTEMLPYYQLEYRTVTLADLPTTIQESLRNLRADFNYALVQVNRQAKKRYSVTGQQASSAIVLTYSDEGLLTAVSNPQNTQSFSQISQLPNAIQTYLRDTPELSGFGLGGQFTLLAKSTFNMVETYTVNLQKGRETWFMTFNGKGELMTRSYLNLV